MSVHPSALAPARIDPPANTAASRPTAALSRALGAVHLGGGNTRFRLWAPHASRVDVVLLPPASAAPESTSAGPLPHGDPVSAARSVPMIPEEDGYHSATIGGVFPGARYFYRVDGADLPDPASCHQPDGVTGPSAVSDAAASSITFAPKPLGEMVIYELHVGAFTEQGTFDAAIDRLAELCDLGVDAIELMPLAAFPGSRNWGYDGVFPFAVQASYGGPDGLARFVDACHSLGMAVILDVVYNHFGPEGAVAGRLGPYFSDRHSTPWGAALNFDGEHSDHVRAFFIESALHFVTTFAVDGLRLDAVNAIVDTSPLPFLEELACAVRARAAALGKVVHLVSEGDDNDPRRVEPVTSGGLGLSALWNDDLHHALHALLTGERGGYYADHGSVLHLARALRDGFTYQGERSTFRKRKHGRPSAHLPADTMIVFAQNHDQVGNRPAGERLVTLAGPGAARLAAAVVLLSPYVPLLFMGEEYGESSPFLYFTDHADPGLAAAVREGRAHFLEPFRFPGEPADPQAESTFARSRLSWPSGDAFSLGFRAYYRELLRLRREVPALAKGGKHALSCFALPEHHAVVMSRWHEGSEVLAFFCFAREPVDIASPVPSGTWRKVLDSTDAAWGGPGADAPAELRSSGSVRVRVGATTAVLYARA